VVSKDEDFFDLANRPGDTGRLLWVRMGNCRTAALLARFENAWPGIEESFGAGHRIVLLP
jgi:predicted nuclease of predicted toxin-antitoxin system